MISLLSFPLVINALIAISSTLIQIIYAQLEHFTCEDVPFIFKVRNSGSHMKFGIFFVP